jgi:hypothetical protein
MTGNHAPSVFTDEDRFLLLTFRIAWPKANADEVRTFIWTNSSGARLYTRAQVGDEETAFGLTRKRASTTAHQAFTPRNLLRRRLWWSLPPPLGVVGLPRPLLLDTDEAGLFLKYVNRPSGKAYVGVRVREPGPYGHTEKWTLILTVSPCGRKWFRFKKEAGTTTAVFNAHVRRVAVSLPDPLSVPPAGPSRTFMWDNLNSHLSAVVTNTVYAAGHTIMTRAPYRPCDGPIEYVFNQLQQELTKRLYLVKNDADLVREVTNIVMNITAAAIDNTFRHCGY